MSELYEMKWDSKNDNKRERERKRHDERKMASYCSDSSFFFFSVGKKRKKGNSALVIVSFPLTNNDTHIVISKSSHIDIFRLCIVIELLKKRIFSKKNKIKFNIF
jgi:hypothetical protein